MDISAFDSISPQEEGRWMTVVHPATGDDLGCRILLAGKHSKAYKRAENEWVDRKVKSGGTTAEQYRAANLKKLVACTLKVEGFTIGDKPLLLDEEKTVARQIYTLQEFIYDQAWEFIHEPAHYIPVIEKKSESGATGASA